MLLLVSCGLVVPFARVPLAQSYSVFAIVIALSIAGIVLTAALLWAQARVSRSVPLAVLSLGYLLTAATMLPYMLLDRGLWPQLGVLTSADAQSSSWLYFEWHLIFVCSASAYFVVLRHDGGRQLDAAEFR